MAAQTHAVNTDIKEAEVRLIGADGSQLGIVSSARALELAEEQDLDLVMIAPQAKPPVCKIMDYGKYRFEQQKREKEASKKQKVVEVKEIRLSLNIDTHDFETKLGHAKKFIGEGNRIKASIRLRGREMAHASRGYEVMARFAEALNEIAVVDKPAKLEGRSIQMFMSPQKSKSK
ncbi:MAG: translation initiation factor IF-3 [Oscillospiraceae bacterium]|nr:translation initiation factor IF-3 [Oscillospiraceae bacterium]